MIITYFNTAVCIEEGKFCHINICDLDENNNILSIKDMADLGFNLKEVGDADYFFFEINGDFLSARNDASLALVRNVDSWEIFREIEGLTIPKIPIFEEGDVIPNKIHQTDESEEIEDQFAENVNSLISNNKGYEYFYYSSKERHDYIYQNYGWDILNLYLRINCRYGAVRADLFRYLCIYKEGGVYLDMKSNCSRPFSEIIKEDDTILFSNWISKKSNKYHNFGQHGAISHLSTGELQQWFLISSPGNKIIRNIIKKVLINILLYHERIHGCGRNAVLAISGPIAFTRAVHDSLSHSKFRMIDSEYEGIIYNNLSSYKRTTDYRYQNTPVIL